ncbi:Vps62-related protein [Cytobacillus sp. IB215665]|uniref:Vps62-related protein n=1 Tax=Cytobacillus sp. IB215665 TaxID=3097357 RepID=UPI002A13AE1F|nr:Vps62-related protein [Cytobacillus sp. IB215665]MDX8367316.1 Vps62-related protein [Cytobacillus sp. IB215665]
MVNKSKKNVIVMLIVLLFSPFVTLNTTNAAESDQYLKMDASIFVRMGNLQTAKAYVQVLEYEDYIGLNYRFFYPYNGSIGGLGIIPSGAHAGDWEGVKILVNKDSNEIESILPSAHDNEHDWTDSSKFEFENGPTHPVIYSAEQSHANYWTEGKHSRLSGFGNDYTNRGQKWDISDDNFIIFNQQNTPWMDFKGRWGESGTSDAVDLCNLSCPDSPKGPGVSKGWFRDVTGASHNNDITDLGANPEQLQKAEEYAEKYAPTVYLHSNELYFPSTVEWLLPQVQLKENGEVLLDKGQVTPWTLVGKEPPAAMITDLSHTTSMMKLNFAVSVSGGDTVTLRREKLYEDGIWRYSDYDVTGKSTWERESVWDTQYRMKLTITNSVGNEKYASPWSYYLMPKPVEIKGIYSSGNLMIVDLLANVDDVGGPEYVYLRREKLYPNGQWGYTDYKLLNPTDWNDVWTKEADFDTEYRVKMLVKWGITQDQITYESDYVYFTMPSE